VVDMGKHEFDAALLILCASVRLSLMRFYSFLPFDARGEDYAFQALFTPSIAAVFFLRFFCQIDDAVLCLFPLPMSHFLSAPCARGISRYFFFFHARCHA